MKVINSPYFYLCILALGLLNNARHLYHAYVDYFPTMILDKIFLVISLVAIEATIFILTVKGKKTESLIFAIGTAFLNALYLLSKVNAAQSLWSWENGGKIVTAIVWSIAFSMVVYLFSDFLDASIKAYSEDEKNQNKDVLALRKSVQALNEQLKTATDALLLSNQKVEQMEKSNTIISADLKEVKEKHDVAVAKLDEFAQLQLPDNATLYELGTSLYNQCRNTQNKDKEIADKVIAIPENVMVFVMTRKAITL